MRGIIVIICVEQAVGFGGRPGEPRAVARLPLQTANHAEFGIAPTGHVVAAVLQFDGGATVEAFLPAFPLGYLDEFLCCGILGTFAPGVPFAVAGAADFCAAASAFPVLSSSVRSAACIRVDLRRFDPFPAASLGTVDAVLGCVFLVFLVPFSFERVSEELVDMFERDVGFSATCWGHVLGVGCGKYEDTL